MKDQRHCACCRVDLPLSEFSPNVVRYCKFCNARLRRISGMYKSAGRVMASVRGLHRPWKFWRQTPELDAMYLDPIERAA